MNFKKYSGQKESKQLIAFFLLGMPVYQHPLLSAQMRKPGNTGNTTSSRDPGGKRLGLRPATRCSDCSGPNPIHVSENLERNPENVNNYPAVRQNGSPSPRDHENFCH